jgi:peptidase A4-like protein
MAIRLLLVASATLSAAFVATGTATAAATPIRPTVSNLAANATGIRHDTEISSNWAGYVVNGSDPTVQTSFSRVSARWIQPAATCTTGRATFSAFWVGLGGFSETSQALEQIGTEADCSVTGKARYAMWYELLPAASVPIKLKVFPGNAVTASVKVNGSKVTLQIKNLTRKTTFTRTLRMSVPDLSSAEWVAEAPSSCNAAGRCVQLPLSNFGSLSFTRASTTANAHTGAISDPTWTATMIQLVADAGSPFVSDGQASTGALPSELSSDGTSFRIDWQAAS